MSTASTCDFTKDAYLDGIYTTLNMQPRLRLLLLAGGYSSRMGSPKYLLPMPAPSSQAVSEPLLIHLLDVLRQFIAENAMQVIEQVTISVRDHTQRAELEALLSKHQKPHSLPARFVVDAVSDAGPVQGLLAAHDCDDIAHWIVTGCDYPLLTSDALTQLLVTHYSSKPALTCFKNDKGFAEPLLSIWTPAALSTLNRLAEEVSSSIGPNRAIKFLQQAETIAHGAKTQLYEAGVEFVDPSDPNWIRSVNTKDEWQAVQSLL